MINAENLKAKGWSDEEIHHAMNVLVEADQQKHPYIKVLDQLLYWVLVFVAIAGNFIFSFAFVPLIIGLPSAVTYLVIGFIAVVFGTLCTTLLHMIDFIDTKHHVGYLVIVPLIALLTFIVIVRQANSSAIEAGLPPHSPWLIGLDYIVFFILPYVMISRGDKWT